MISPSSSDANVAADAHSEDDADVIHGGGFRGGGLDVSGRAGRRGRERGGEVGEIENCGTPLDAQRRHVVSPRRHFRGGVSPQPYPRLLPRLPNLRHPFPPAPHPHASVHRVSMPTLSAPLPAPFRRSFHLCAAQKNRVLHGRIGRSRRR
nr:Uncharacterized protein TCM_015082 [Ipomoea batatas]